MDGLNGVWEQDHNISVTFRRTLSHVFGHLRNHGLQSGENEGQFAKTEQMP